MPDVFSTKKRSEVMSKIRRSGNKDTELVMISLMRKWHITGWRRYQPLLGKPDFTFQCERLVIFVDGCFWHGCPEHASQPKNNRLFWKKKLDSNKRRDKLVMRKLKLQGWKVYRVWEHDLGNPYKVMTRLQTLLKKIGVNK